MGKDNMLNGKNNELNGEKEHINSPDIHQFNHAQYWGYGLVIIIYTVAEYAQEWESLKYFTHPTTEPNNLIFILRLILFVELVILIGRWFIATINELDMWSNSGINWTQWANSFTSKQNTYAALLSLALVVGLLLAFIDNILIMVSIRPTHLAGNELMV